MRASRFHLATVKETPADAEIASHRLMLRTGMIRRLGAGIYTWTPLGLRVLRKVERIVREEMERAGSLEVLMPAIQPAELWQETGRWEAFGPLLLKMQDRGKREYCFGPTHEEVATEFARAELRSYRQLPICIYQIQTKFRDEIRPRFGVMRAREFVMKDAYSFHMNQDCMDRSYAIIHHAYSRIIERLGLRFRAVAADSGAIGGATSHEFQVLADSGEDAIAFCPSSDYAANVELAEAVSPGDRPKPSQTLATITTPDQRSIEQLATHLMVPAQSCLKTLIFETGNGDLHAICLRGDHQLNELKLSKLAPFQAGFALASAARVQAATGCPPGFVGPIGLRLPILADRAAAIMADFVCGANRDGMHMRGANWERDAAFAEVADIRNVVAGDASPDGQGSLEIARGIEVGHIFQLGTKYSEAMRAMVLNEEGKSTPPIMGCYGLGVSRMVAAAIEQNHDEHGIVWPAPIAPFQLAILPLNAHKSQRVRSAAEALYAELSEAGIDVLLDDRKLRPGVMFAECELIGIPHRIVIGEKTLDEGCVEYRARRASDNEQLSLEGLADTIEQRLRL